MTELFKRAARIVVDTIEIVVDPDRPGHHLDVAFTIERSLKPEPNTAQIEIFNLNPDHRKQLEELGAVAVSVEAGYRKETSLLFLGNLRETYTEREGPNLVTVVASGDGEKEYRGSRINTSVGPGVSNDIVIHEIVKALGIGTGNLEDEAVKAAFASGAKIFPQGAVLSGQASREMTLLAESFGFEWSIQNGALQLLRKGRALGSALLLLSSDTGLIRSPSVDNKGVVSAQTLLIPDLSPGRIVQIESERLKGRFRVEKCKYVGDTSAAPWYVDLEAKKV